MGAVMIRCPETGREIATGYEADPARFGEMPVFFARSYCPICRTEHEWFAKEAWVCEATREQSGVNALAKEKLPAVEW
jgi:hypothetical protein